jgi:malate dehydrogenase (oxaloacetate-decarboxylating)(NADP+)
LALKLVREDKAALFERFADIDSIDLGADAEGPDEFINAMRYIGRSFAAAILRIFARPNSLSRRLTLVVGYAD